MYDIKHGAEAVKNDAYKKNRLQHKDWAIIEQSAAVLLASAAATKLLEGTNYITISLVLPYMYRLIEGSDDGMLYLPWKAAGQQWLRAAQMDPDVRAARKLLHDDFKKRWLEEMPSQQRMELDISTLLDPRFKDYNFPGLRNTNLDNEKESALGSLKAVWLANWKPVAPTPTPTTTGVTTPSPSFTTKALTTEAAKGASSSFFDFPLAPMDVEEAAEATLEGHEDELDKYLALPVEKNTDLDVLAWWKAKDNQKDGLPILAKMARQFLGRPASSAGVERMFSKAGKLHGEDKASQEDGTLEHCLFASANTE
jgi:hypothetical protein